MQGTTFRRAVMFGVVAALLALFAAPVEAQELYVGGYYAVDGAYAYAPFYADSSREGLVQQLGN